MLSLYMIQSNIHCHGLLLSISPARCLQEYLNSVSLLITQSVYFVCHSVIRLTDFHYSCPLCNTCSLGKWSIQFICILSTFVHICISAA